MIVKDNISDDEDKIIEDLKMAVKQHIGSFAVPHCFMVTNFVSCLYSISHVNAKINIIEFTVSQCSYRGYA